MLAAKAYLQEPGADGVSLYGHLTEVLATMLENKTQDPLGSLESLSQQIKPTHFTPESAQPPAPPPTEPSEEGGAWHTAASKLLTVGHPLHLHHPPRLHSPAASLLPIVHSPPPRTGSPRAPAAPLLALHAHSRQPPHLAPAQDTAPKEDDEVNPDFHNPNLVEEAAYFATCIRPISRACTLAPPSLHPVLRHRILPSAPSVASSPPPGRPTRPLLVLQGGRRAPC